MNNNEIIKMQRLIRRTNRLMSKFFAIEKGKEEFINWLNKTDLNLEKLINMSVEEFVKKAEESNIIYPVYAAVQPITSFMKIKAKIYEAYINTLETKTFCIPNPYYDKETKD